MSNFYFPSANASSNAQILSVFSHKKYSFPKCPPTEVCAKTGHLRSNFSITAPTLKSNTFFTASAILWSAKIPVPKVLTSTLVGSGTPIAYDSVTSHSSARFAAIMFLAMYLAKYAPLLSTLLASFPLNAPPP